MPTPQLRKLAARFHVSVETAERAWNKCKRKIKPKEGQETNGYGAVYRCTENTLKALAKKRARNAAGGN